MPKNNDIFNINISMENYEDDEGACIYKYHSASRPPVQFYLNEDELENKKNNLYIGFELEFDNTTRFLPPSRKKQIIKKNNNLIRSYNYLYYMLDGSVKNGLEMISQPSTYNFYLKNKDIFKSIFENIINDGYISSNKCGLHFHINKDYFDSNYQSSLFYSKIQNLLTLCDKFWPNFVSFSNRKKMNLDKWAHKFNTPPKDIVKTIVNKNHQGIYNNYFSKYTAINFNHSDTIEFRIFSSTLDIEDFYSLLEFIKNIAETVKNKNNEYIKDCNFESLIYGKNITNYYKKHYNVRGLNKYKSFDISFFDENDNNNENSQRCDNNEDNLWRNYVIESYSEPVIATESNLNQNYSNNTFINASIRNADIDTNLLYDISRCYGISMNEAAEAISSLANCSNIRWGNNYSTDFTNY